MTYQEIGVRRELAKQQGEVSYQSNPCPKCETQNITQKAAIV